MAGRPEAPVSRVGRRQAGSGASPLAAKVYHNRKSSPPFVANQGKPMSNSDDLKSMGLKATIPRLKILALFEKTEVRHLTAEDVYRLLLAENLDIGLATVYRVLTQFEQAGLLERHYFESGKAVFELSPGQHHDHLVCIDCGQVEEFYDAEIERRQTRIARERGFVIREHALYLYAECTKPDCPHRGSTVKPPGERTRTPS
jgi:Fur family ferric uptake transcriptional regulator